jgi:hypothetical protein
VLAESVTVDSASPLLGNSDGFFTRDSTVNGLRATPVNISLDDSAQLRTDFRSLVFWLGSIATDADGRASTSVTLPDSLTTFRIIAVAGDAASHFGAADTEIRSSKPLTLLASFPAFLFGRRPRPRSAPSSPTTPAAREMRWSPFAVWMRRE